MSWRSWPLQVALGLAMLAFFIKPLVTGLIASGSYRSNNSPDNSTDPAPSNKVVERLRIEYENSIYTRLADNPPQGVTNDSFTVRADIRSINEKHAKGRLFVRGVQYEDNNLPRGRLAFTNMVVVIEGEGTIMCQGLAPDGPGAILGGTGRYLGKIGEFRRIRGYPVGLMAGDGRMFFDYEFQVPASQSEKK